MQINQPKDVKPQMRQHKLRICVFLIRGIKAKRH